MSARPTVFSINPIATPQLCHPEHALGRLARICHPERSRRTRQPASTGNHLSAFGHRSQALLSAALTLTLLLLTACAPPRSSHIVIGAKNFTEQVILGELLAQEIEASGAGPVERRFWLAGSYLCQQALISNRIDAYVEYTGTALTAILKQPVMRDPTLVNATITALYAQLYQVRVFPSLGFQNTFAMVIRGADASPPSPPTGV